MTNHVIPVGGEEPVHICSSGCWCHPLEEQHGNPTDGLDFVIIHHAQDLREKWERQGISKVGNAWVIVRQEWRLVFPHATRVN